MLLFSQKSSLHASISDWYETVHENDLSPYYTTLADHSFRAVKFSEKQNLQLCTRAISYLNRAIEKLNLNMMVEEVTGFTDNVQELIKFLPESERENQQQESKKAQAVAFLF